MLPIQGLNFKNHRSSPGQQVRRRSGNGLILWCSGSQKQGKSSLPQQALRGQVQLPCKRNPRSSGETPSFQRSLLHWAAEKEGRAGSRTVSGGQDPGLVARCVCQKARRRESYPPGAAPPPSQAAQGKTYHFIPPSGLPPNRAVLWEESVAFPCTMTPGQGDGKRIHGRATMAQNKNHSLENREEALKTGHGDCLRGMGVGWWVVWISGYLFSKLFIKRTCDFHHEN